ncbi:NAD(P)/FAD-dependent oxidoreductase [Actinocatenispora rupis]|uniref:Thioredoxin reductase n=1 Tax=Actinocatenispora rupis TaxID=519421 RepID=A0A8J3J870_9ACTN|nr:NAD(P)/FAD-dependent oxidoreductase [Actinocatenispora rupis]GID11173.1 thioredoxin reductase [Actinocatenispora rupis]
MDHDVLVVGGGAAGLSAALVLTRARRRVLVVDAGNPRNAPAAHLHGYLSRDGAAPAELLSAGRAEVAGYGGEIRTGTVTAVTRTGDGFHAVLAGGSAVTARRLVLAGGVRDELPDIPGLAERWGRDVLHCPYCHGYEVADRPIGVLGGPMTTHRAQLLRQWSADVVLFPHTAEVSAEDRAMLDAIGVRVVDGRVTGVTVEDDHLTAVRLADGTEHPRAALFAGSRMQVDRTLPDALGLALREGPTGTWIDTDETGRASVPGVWAVGNAADPPGQLITAAAAGARAGAMVNADLIEQDAATAVRARQSTSDDRTRTSAAVLPA